MQASNEKLDDAKKSLDAKSARGAGSNEVETSSLVRHDKRKRDSVEVISDEKQRPIIHKLSKFQLAQQSVPGPDLDEMALDQVIVNPLLIEQSEGLPILNKYALALQDQRLRGLVKDLNSFSKKLQKNLQQIQALQLAIDTSKISRSELQETMGKTCLLELEAAAKNSSKIEKVLVELQQMNSLAQQALHFTSESDRFRRSCLKLRRDTRRITGDEQILNLMDSYKITAKKMAQQAAKKTNLLAMLTPPRVLGKKRIDFSKSALFGLTLRDMPRSRQLFSKERENLAIEECKQAAAREDDGFGAITGQFAEFSLSSPEADSRTLPQSSVLHADAKLAHQPSNLFALITDLGAFNGKFGEDFELLQAAIGRYNDAQWANQNLERCCADVLDNVFLILKNLGAYSALLKNINTELSRVMASQHELPSAEERERVRLRLKKVAITKDGIESRIDLASSILSSILSDFQESLCEGYVIELEAIYDDGDYPHRKKIIDSLDKWGEIEGDEEDKPPIVGFVQAKLADIEASTSLPSLGLGQ